MRVGIIIGRFQLPYPHKGHLDLIKHVLNKSDRVLVFIGKSPANLNDKNPIPVGLLIGNILNIDPKIEVKTIKDHPSDSYWSYTLDNEILTHTDSKDEITLYGSRDSFLTVYNGKFKTEYIESLPNIPSSTDIRNSIQPCNSEDFFNGMIFAQNYRFPIVYPTVDIFVYNMSYGTILLGRKPGHHLWQLPGGFIDKGEKASEAATRELREECPNIETTVLKYIDTFPIEDYRYKGTKDGVLTTLFKCYYQRGDLTAGDDLEELKWFTIKEANEVIVNNHKKLLNA